MRNRFFRIGLFAISLALAAGERDPGQLTRFQQKIRQDMASIPNYTCLEIIARASREPRSRNFKPIDTVRLEVSSVAGKEMFAWPGARQFEDRDVTSLVTSGTMGTGMFAGFARSLFVTGKGDPQYGRVEKQAGRSTVRYDFHLTSEQSGFLIRVGGVSAIVAAKGSFWFDPVSLDLVRLDVHGDAIPYSLRLAETSIQTFYARTHIGDSDALLPQRSEVTMTHFSGAASRDAVEFSQCHEYQSESTIRFDAPSPSAPEVPKPPVREVDPPAGLLVPIELETAIDSKTAAVGDTVHARVVQDVRQNGELAVPRGAAVTGRIRNLSRSPSSSTVAVGIGFSEIEWAGARAVFYAELVDLDPKSAGARRPLTYSDGHAKKVVIDNEIKGVGVFYIEAAAFRIPSGFHMVWRTLAPPQPRPIPALIEPRPAAAPHFG